VFLIVGCNSDEQVAAHKNKCVMTHVERCEAIRHCRWVDKIAPDAPWVLTREFLAAHEVDYVAHDEDPYVSAGVDDVYQLAKDMGACRAGATRADLPLTAGAGMFLPTRRTPGVSTSELLERIVQKYRRRDFDAKLEKMGAGELKAAGSDYDDGSDDEPAE
jgi:choline-phosphate cytidylyltransferase